MVGISLRVLRASSVLSLVLLAACGGRTTGLQAGDSDFDPSLPSDGGSSGNPGSAGTSGSASGGNAGTPGTGTGGVTGTGGSSGSPPSGGAAQGGSSGLGTIEQECHDYCDTATAALCGYARASRECNATCTQQLYLHGPVCQRLAIQMVDCITNSYRTHDNCEIEECSALSNAYLQCIASPPPPPAPGPVPTPVPTTCSTSSSSGPSVCSLDMKCNDGTYYNVNCNQGGPDFSSCTCKSTNGNSGGAGVFTLNESVGFACFDGLSVCGFPEPGLK